MQNYNQIRFLSYFLGFWCGGNLWCSQNWQSSTERRFSQIGNHPQDEVLAKLAILHKEKFYTNCQWSTRHKLSQFGNHQQDEVLANLAITHKMMF
jgi:hypothetical protein